MFRCVVKPSATTGTPFHAGIRARAFSDLGHVPAAAVLLLAVVLAAPSHAVHVSPSGSGQALVVPLYTVEGGFDSLISVTNAMDTTRSAAALKVHFISTEGEIQGLFNLYLWRLSTWAFALGEQDGQARSGEFGAGCLLEEVQGEPVLVEQFDLDATTGYIEIIEMGRLTDSTLLNALSDGECDAFAEFWSDDEPGDVLDPPAGGVRATGSLINVARGTMYSFNGTALDNFRTTAMHTAPGVPLPDLSSAENHPEITTSRNCNISPCVEDEWDNPADAVSAALMALEITGEFVVSDSIEGRTEWHLTFPTRRFYPQAHPLHDPEALVLATDRTGSSRGVCIISGGHMSICEDSKEKIGLPGATAAMRIENTSSEDEGAERFGIFNFTGIQPVGEFIRESAGMIRTRFEGSEPVLTSNLGTEYDGRPVIGLVFQEFTNAEVQQSDQSRIASYGNSFEASYRLQQPN